jgi:hypothetical protein
VKCIRHIKSGKIMREKNNFASDKVDTDEYEYCSKSEFKRLHVQQKPSTKEND